LTQSDRSKLAAEAFIYGYPMVLDLAEVKRLTEVGLGAMPPAPFNRFTHATKLAGPDDRFVSVNNDTLYSVAQVDVGVGALSLDVPATDGRYYVLQLVDAWTNNFAYIGRRATGTAAQGYLLVPPGFEGDAPAGLTKIELPTRVVSIVGRFACGGEDDVPAVAALQQQLKLLPLNRALIPPEGVPEPSPEALEALAPLEQIRTFMRAFPPHADDVAYQQKFAAIGLLDATCPYTSPDPELEAGIAAGRAAIERATQAGSPDPNGWRTLSSAFNYNNHFFEVGTVDSPDWTIPDRATRQITRAVAARVGLWGNHAYEAVYGQVFEDADGTQLHGANRYTLRFEQAPPVDAFWSLTMYDMPDFHLVPNPIDRYSIGDRTPGIVTAADGSITLVLQADAPSDPAERANWLPTPAGDFRPILRLYQPGAAILDGSYVYPPVIKR
jgi:hypothetical protein